MFIRVQIYLWKSSLKSMTKYIKIDILEEDQEKVYFNLEMFYT